jgi:hypothetical protein
MIRLYEPHGVVAGKREPCHESSIRRHHVNAELVADDHGLRATTAQRVRFRQELPHHLSSLKLAHKGV